MAHLQGNDICDGAGDTGNLTPDGQIGPDRLIVYDPDKVQSSEGPVINYGEGRGQQNRKMASRNLFSSRQGRAVGAPPPPPHTHTF